MNCSGAGLSKPSWVLTASTSAAEALSPARVSAASPEANCMSANVTTETARTVTLAPNSWRRARAPQPAREFLPRRARPFVGFDGPGVCCDPWRRLSRAGSRTLDMEACCQRSLASGSPNVTMPTLAVLIARDARLLFFLIATARY